jgi:hypothetical protein
MERNKPPLVVAVPQDRGFGPFGHAAFSAFAKRPGVAVSHGGEVIRMLYLRLRDRPPPLGGIGGDEVAVIID